MAPNQPMNYKALRRKIKLLKERCEITSAFERALARQGTWTVEGVWYKPQKEHWLGWLFDYDGPGFYGRKRINNRSAKSAYNHIVCPPMVLWLPEASGIQKSLVTAAKRAALKAPKSLPSKSAAIRKIIPWAMIEAALESI